MMAMTKALKEWETRNGKVAAEEKDIRLYGGLMFENNTKRQFVNKLVRARGARRFCGLREPPLRVDGSYFTPHSLTPPPPLLPPPPFTLTRTPPNIPAPLRRTFRFRRSRHASALRCRRIRLTA